MNVDITWAIVSGLGGALVGAGWSLIKATRVFVQFETAIAKVSKLETKVDQLEESIAWLKSQFDPVLKRVTKMSNDLGYSTPKFPAVSDPSRQSQPSDPWGARASELMQTPLPAPAPPPPGPPLSLYERTRRHLAENVPTRPERPPTTYVHITAKKPPGGEDDGSGE